MALYQALAKWTSPQTAIFRCPNCGMSEWGKVSKEHVDEMKGAKIPALTWECPICGMRMFLPFDINEVDFNG